MGPYGARRHRAADPRSWVQVHQDTHDQLAVLREKWAARDFDEVIRRLIDRAGAGPTSPPSGPRMRHLGGYRNERADPGTGDPADTGQR